MLIPIAPALGISGLVTLHALRYVKERLKATIAGDEKDFMAEKREAWLQEFSESMGLSTGMQAAEAFNTYTENRIQNAAGFESIMVGEQTLSEALKARDDKTKMNQAFTNALALTDETQKAQEKFTKRIAKINEAIQSPDFIYDAEGLVARLYEIRNDAHKAIVNQQAHELETLNDEHQFTQFRTALELDEETGATLQENLQEALEASHQKELAAFDKATNDAITTLHQTIQKERDRIHFLAALYDNNKTMRRAIEELAAQKKASKDGASITLSLSNTDNEKALNKAVFKGITLNELPMLQTVTGRTLHPQGDGYAMQLPNRLFSPFYYGGWNNQLEKDLKSMAMATRANGHEAITMTIHHQDQKHAESIARKAYAACRETGFQKEKITLNVNGKMMKPEELVKSSKTYQAIESKAQAYEQETTIPKIPQSQTDKKQAQGRKQVKALEFKNTLTTYRQKAQQTEAQQAPQKTTKKH